MNINIIFGKEYSNDTIDKDLHDYIYKTRYKTFSTIDTIKRYNEQNLFEIQGNINDDCLEKFTYFLGYPIYISYIYSKKDYFDSKYNIDNSDFLLGLLFDEVAVGELFKKHISMMLLSDFESDDICLDINEFINNKIDSIMLSNAYTNMFSLDDNKSDFNITLFQCLDNLLPNLIEINY